MPVIIVGGGSILDSASHRRRVGDCQTGALCRGQRDRRGHCPDRRRDRPHLLAGRDESRRGAGTGQARGHRQGSRGRRSSGTVEIVEVEEVPLAYLPGNATRIMVKAVGDLAEGIGMRMLDEQTLKILRSVPPFWAPAVAAIPMSAS